MSDMKELEIHEAANLFPMEEETIPALAEDIKTNGLNMDIELCDGKLIDGRRRMKACQIAGVEPRFSDVDPADPVAYVMSLNLHRRHLTPSQRAMVAARARSIYDRQAKERQVRKPADSVVENLPQQNTRARDAAGKAVSVSGKSVDYATRVIEKGEPEVIKAVDEGRMSVSTAAVLVHEPRDVQVSEATKPKRNRKYNSVSAKVKEPDKECTETVEDSPRKSRGVGILRANEAIDCMKRIPKSDGLRSRAFQMVGDWIKDNK